MVEYDAVRELLHQFLALQAQRSEAYARFDAGFRRFLDTQQEGIYRKLLAETTHTFQQLSSQVREVEQALRDDVQRPDLASLLRQVQEQEREKLRVTLTWQALRAAHHRHKFSWQLPDGAEASPAIGEQEAPCDAAHDTHVHAHGSCEGPPAEPTKPEYEAAVAEAIQQKQQIVTAINDLLEEVQYEARGDAG